MAEEIEEPIHLEESSLQAGSVSFGKFESEILSWERKSTFSQNRYLEEVEKYSTPGSVTQKKAYFEAHFKKKKDVVCPDSECQSGTEAQTNVNDDPDDMNYMQEIDHGNEEIHLTHNYENAVSSDEHGGPETLDMEEECNEISSHDSQMDPFSVSSISGEDGDHLQVEPGEMQKIHSECDTQHLDNTEQEVEEKKKPTDEAESANALIECDNHLPRSQTITNDCVADTEKLQKPKHKVSAQVLKKRTSGTSEDSDKDTRKTEKERMKTGKEKQLPQKVIVNMSSQIKSVKVEDPKTKKEKPLKENRSGKDQKARNAAKLVPTRDFYRIELNPQHSANRVKRSTAKPEATSSTAMFNLKSNDRAEKRREFYIKLEEKLHAKEAETNQFLAKKQEDKEAQFKQFRKSLNFKATPMPSFYNEGVSQGSETKKIVSARAKLTNIRSKSTSPGRNTRSLAFPKSRNQHSLPVNESAGTTVWPHSTSTALPTEAANSSTKPSTTTTKKQTGKRLDAAGKEDTEKRKDANIQKQHRSHTSRVRKGEMTDVITSVTARTEVAK